MGSQNRIGKLSEHSSTLNAFESKGVGIWIDLFQGDMFSYKSFLSLKLESLNLNEGWLSYGQNTVMGWGRRKKTG